MEHVCPIYKTLDDTVLKIEQSIPAITSEIKGIYSLIKEQHFWQPPESVKPEISQLYQGLKLPIFNRCLSLLLHGLDTTSIPSPCLNAFSAPRAPCRGKCFQLQHFVILIALQDLM